MRAAGEQADHDSAAGDNLLAVTKKQPATPNFADARGHPRAVSSSAASAAGGSPMDVDPEIEVVYSCESDPPSDLKSLAKPDRKAVGAKTTTAVPRGRLGKTFRHESLGASDESEYSSRGSN